MSRRGIAFVMVVGALAAAPGAVGKAPLGGVDVCGAGGACVHVSGGDAERIFVGATDLGPAARAAPFFQLRWQWGDAGPVETAYWVPSRATMRWTTQGTPELATSWRSVDAAAVAALRRATAGLAPLAVPRPTRVTVGGREVRAPATYLRLFEGRPTSTWRATPWLRVTLAAAATSPWTDGLSDVTLGRLGPYLSVDGGVYRLPSAMWRRAIRGVSLSAHR